MSLLILLVSFLLFLAPFCFFFAISKKSYAKPLHKQTLYDGPRALPLLNYKCYQPPWYVFKCQSIYVNMCIYVYVNADTYMWCSVARTASDMYMFMNTYVYINMCMYMQMNTMCALTCICKCK